MSVRLPASPLGLAIALALSSAAVPALAQDATNLDTVIVTGTRAADRTVLESTSPVDVLTAEDIRKAGVVNGELGSALQALLPSFNFPRQSNSGGADHVRAAQLRGNTDISQPRKRRTRVVDRTEQPAECPLQSIGN